jgi:membrane-associated protease RseP (regulator of RpoE activity)
LKGETNMRKLVHAILLLLPFLAIVTYGAQCLSFEPPHEVYGFSSDEAFGGGSYLGVDTRDITPDRLGDLKLKEEHGVEVTLVDQDAPAGKAGLKEHDVILTLNGSGVESVEQLRRMIHEIPPGRVVTLGISRDGLRMTIKAQLADRKKTFGSGHESKDFRFAMPAMPTMPAMPAMPAMPEMDIPVSIVVVHSAARSGLMVENLTPQLGDFVGAKNGQGVLVRSVDKGSRAEKAGFHAGDVIVRVNDEPIHDSGDFTHALRGRKENTVQVNIIRDKKEQTLTLSLPERRQSGFLDEKFDVSTIDAETRNDLSRLESELAREKPELERVAREIQLHAAEEMERAKPEIERAARELQSHQEELKKQMQELERELHERSIELEKELEHELHSFSEI